MKMIYIYLKGYDMKEYCLIEIPEEVTAEEFNSYINLWVISMKNGQRFMKLNKVQKDLMQRLQDAMKNSNIGNRKEMLSILE